jgi:hypothetical protein
MTETEAKVNSEHLLGDYGNYEAGLRPIKLNHHESTSEELESESSPIPIEFCYAFYSAGALFGVMTSMGVISFLIHMNAQRIFARANFLDSVMCGILSTVTILLILFMGRSLILNIFRAYESRNIGNEFTTHSILSSLDSKIINGMVMGASIGLYLTWVLYLLYNRLR